jgi:Icc-related predicted phosphoesterase
VSDLHGDIGRCRKLFSAIAAEKPQLVFVGGDLTPAGFAAATDSTQAESDFIRSFLSAEMHRLKENLRDAYPQVFIIMGNDDLRADEPALIAGDAAELWHYAHEHRFELGEYDLYGYNYVPPTPFLLKDWERYDLSRYLDPGDISPEEGWRSVIVSDHEKRYSTIANDLQRLTSNRELGNSVLLLHAPPHNTSLDRCNNDGKLVDHVPLDLHVGSIAIRRLIEQRQPHLTLHGHIHESSALSGSWKECIGRTVMLSAAFDGPELALIRFNLGAPAQAIRELL